MKIEISTDNVPAITDWLATRGGVAVWESLDLARAGQRTFTPADCTKPSWHYGNTPIAIITDPADITVCHEALFKAVPVALRRNGMMLTLTDASQRKVDKIMAACREKHGDAFYKRDVLPTANASIGVYYTFGRVSLTP